MYIDKKKYLELIDDTIKKGRFKDNWDSLSYFRVPQWYKNVKLGIFIHWGVYSVPAFGSEWYPRNMYIQGSKEYEHHIKTYGEHKNFGYKDFINTVSGLLLFWCNYCSIIDTIKEKNERN